MKIKARISTNRVEPGTHFDRKSIEFDVLPPRFYDIPSSECKERRADLGKYHPILTFSALERALRRRHAFSQDLPEDFRESYAYIGNEFEA